MTTVFVAFTDSSETIIQTVFGVSQQGSGWENTGEIDSTDARYLAFIDPASTLPGAQSVQNALLSSSCAAAIVSGFQSSALGEPHTYPSTQNDQTNLIGSVAAGVPVTFWCEDSTGAWSYAQHTADQIKQVLIDAATARMAYSQKLAGYVAQVAAATTVEDVQAIVWQ